MDWFRHYHGCVFNPKWRTVARRTGATIERVAFVWSSLLEHASSQQGEERGSVATWDPEIVADHLMCDADQLKAIYLGMVEVGSIVRHRLEGWPRRQFASDSSAERVRRHRAAKRLNGQDTDPGVTPCNVTSAIGNAPEQSRTESESETETHRGGLETLTHAPEPAGAQITTTTSSATPIELRFVQRCEIAGANPATVRSSIAAWRSAIPPGKVLTILDAAADKNNPYRYAGRAVGNAITELEAAKHAASQPEVDPFLEGIRRSALRDQEHHHADFTPAYRSLPH